MKKYVLLFFINVFTGAIICNLKAQTCKPHILRSGLNQFGDSEIISGNEWHIINEISIDSTQSRSLGSNSLKLNKDLVPGMASIPFSWMMSRDTFPITPCATYTFSFFMRSANGPAIVLSKLIPLDSNGVQNGKGASNRCSNSIDDIWEECSIVYTAKEGDRYMYFEMLRRDSPRPDSAIWLDDFYFGEGLGFEAPPACKTPFEGSLTRVDSLGNIEINDSGVWKPFFPIAIYAASQRADSSIYSEQGFNCLINSGNQRMIQRAKNQVSAFNPEGMYSCFKITQFVSPNGGLSGDTATLTSRLAEVADSALHDRIIGYYWDNEAYEEWDIPSVVIPKLYELDTDQNGQRMHPVLILQGNTGIARSYSDRQDIVATYSGGMDLGGNRYSYRNNERFHIIDNLQNQKSPLSWQIINSGNTEEMDDYITEGHFRVTVYNGLISGTKAFAFWRDHYPNPTLPWIEELPFWSAVPTIRTEIDQLIPLIRMPHWTSWSAHSDRCELSIGTREMDELAYLIIANNDTIAINTTITLSGLPYAPDNALDYFTNESISSISNSTFTLTLPPLGTYVLKLEQSSSSQTALYTETQITAYPNPTNNGIGLRFQGTMLPSSVKISVVDPFGRKNDLGSRKISNNEIYIESKDLFKGINFMKISFDNQIQIKRILVL